MRRQTGSHIPPDVPASQDAKVTSSRQSLEPSPARARDELRFQKSLFALSAAVAARGDEEGCQAAAGGVRKPANHAAPGCGETAAGGEAQPVRKSDPVM